MPSSQLTSKITSEQFDHLVRSTIPMSELFDFKIESLKQGCAKVRVQYNEKLVRAGGTIAGPVLFTLADMTLYGVCLSLIGMKSLAVTANMNINFLSKPGQVDLIAEGVVLRLGRSLMFGEVKIYSEGTDAIVAHAVGSYALPAAGR